jgi:NitT/TauT family transport system ATP-binding protein
MSNVIIDNVSLIFKGKGGHSVTALENISFELEDKKFAVIVGPSGCGKSSLLYLIAGLNEPSSGVCKISDQIIKGPGQDRGMVFQSYTLFPWLNVLKNVEFGLKLRGIPTADRAKIAREYLGEVGLEGFENAYPKQLSGGMMQRVALARALANDPEVLLMDEPFGALDSQTRSIMQELLLKIWEHSHKTVLFVTHDIDEAIFLGDHVYVMSARPGQMIEEVDVNIERPRSIDVLTSELFIRLKRRIRNSLHGEVLKSMGSNNS